MNAPFEGWAEARIAAFDRWLDDRFPNVWPPEFAEPLRYPVFGGGKRIRPLLTFAAWEALRDAPDGAALACAASVELVHTYSLVHDDLPCMDDDDVRRGRPTVHRAFDEGIAVLVGDALLTHAFAVLADAPLPAETVVRCVRELAAAAGYPGMVGGQVADVGFARLGGDLDAVRRVHEHKTGALITASVRLGGLAAGATEAQLDALTAYGAAVGLAFQLADDVLDAHEAQDADGPPTYVRLLGVDETRRLAFDAADRAQRAVAGLPAPARLAQLARYTVERSH